MNNQARQILQQCIRDYGTTLGREPQRLDALLKDYAKGQHKREIFVFVQAAKENVIEQLLNNTAPLELIAGTLAHQLTENYGIDRQLADWAIESWLFALNLSRPANKVEQKQATPTVADKPNRDPNLVTRIKFNQSKVNNTVLIDGRYLDNRDGTVTDQKTGLQWMRCSLGQTWDGTTCQGEAKTYNWNEANNIVKQSSFLGFKIGEKFSFAGYNDWRLPTIKELECIIEKNKIPSINQHAFPNTSPASSVWSSSPSAYFSDFAWNVLLPLVFIGSYGKTDYYPVRLVRGGQ